MTIDDLPLFPLNVVLFPGMVLPLHIFEERYKQMISRCLSDDPRFGVALIQDGVEVGGPATVHGVGCLARIVGVSKYDDGRLDLLALGVQRMRLLDIMDDMPYMRGRVELFNDACEEPEYVQEAVDDVLEMLTTYSRMLGQEDELQLTPDDPEALSFVAGVLPMAAAQKQELLAATLTSERLASVRKFLRREIELLKLIGPTRPLEWPGLPRD